MTDFLPENQNVGSIWLLFLDEMQKHTATLQQLVQKFDSEEEDPEVKKALSTLFHEIVSAARIVGMHPLAEEAKKFEGIFDKEKLLAILQVLREISQKSEKELQDGYVPALQPLKEIEEKVGELIENKKIEPDEAMMELFHVEIESHSRLLIEELVAFEKEPSNPERIALLLRTAHSIKGAFRVMHLDFATKIAHLIEECFVRVQKGTFEITSDHIDLFLHAMDLFQDCSALDAKSLYPWVKDHTAEFQGLTTQIDEVLQDPNEASRSQKTPLAPNRVKEEVKSASEKDRVVRVSSVSINRLMGLAGESLVASKLLEPIAEQLFSIKKKALALSSLTASCQGEVEGKKITNKGKRSLKKVNDNSHELNQLISESLEEFDLYQRRDRKLSSRLYREVINSRMRPFYDGVEGFYRMVRDVAKDLGKMVEFEILGKSTPVDRDILEKLESPLNHLVRNALSHGIETPEERVQKGKSREGHLRIEARHKGGMLNISVVDDGKGISWTQVKKKVQEQKGLLWEEVQDFSEKELIDFLFQPGFTTVPEVTELSGRGVGLDVVSQMVREVGGSVRFTAGPALGTRIDLLLPLTLSVVRALIVSISGEPYAFPLAQIERTLVVPKEELRVIKGQSYIAYEKKNLGLVEAWDVFGLERGNPDTDILTIVVLSDEDDIYGLVVDEFIGEKELVVQALDPVVQDIRWINSGSMLEDGSPILIVEVEELIREMNNSAEDPGQKEERLGRKRVLIAEDSLVVRKKEVQLLEEKGYLVEAVGDGVQAWNALRLGKFDLVVTDIEMPRMDGITLIEKMKSSEELKALPVIIVSNKNVKKLGLAVGADCYLDKTTQLEKELIQAVEEIIGPYKEPLV